jgi:hypothetical protein
VLSFSFSFKFAVDSSLPTRLFFKTTCIVKFIFYKYKSVICASVEIRFTVSCRVLNCCVY